jgi:hypothetical protein
MENKNPMVIADAFPKGSCDIQNAIKELRAIKPDENP